MQLFIVLMIFVSLVVSIAPLAHPETIKLVDEMKNSGTAVNETSSSPVSGGMMYQGISGMMEGAQIANPIHTVKRTAEEAARTVGRSLGQYIRGKYQQMKNNDLLIQFNETLALSVAGLPLNAEEKNFLIREVERAYMEDVESGKYELDQMHFKDLAYVIRKEYAELALEKMQDGIIDTYDFKGRIKTKWTKLGGQLNGPVITYYENGEILFIDLYENGRRESRKKYDPEGRLIFEQSYTYDADSATETVTAEHHQAEDNIMPASSNPVALQPSAPPVPDQAIAAPQDAEEPVQAEMPKVRRIPVL